MSRYQHHPASYRDPSGFLFMHDGILYRQVNQVYKKHYEHLQRSGLYEELAGKNLLIQHQEIPENLTGNAEWFLCLQPEKLHFISYPYEWSFNMLKDAALHTIGIAEAAIGKGMILKDASAYNVQLHHGKMIFMDSLSFEIYDEQQPWVAYRQFCQHFYAPLALMHFLQQPLNHLMLAWPEGIPLDTAVKMLPWKSRFHLHTYLHMHMHASAAGKEQKQKNASRSFSKNKMLNLLRSLKEGIQSFRFDKPTGVWSGYYEEACSRADYVDQKKQIIRKWISELEWKTAFDAGCNEGEFTELLKGKATMVVSADMDHYAVNELYKKVKDTPSEVHPLVMDLSNPSPSIGVNNKERPSFLQRIRTDLVLALALIHHLSIGKNIPFEMVAEMFAGAGRYLVIEFVPLEDEKASGMISFKKELEPFYTEDRFRKAFEKHFTIIKKETVPGSMRTLYLMQSHEI